MSTEVKGVFVSTRTGCVCSGRSEEGSRRRMRRPLALECEAGRAARRREFGTEGITGSQEEACTEVP